MRTSLRSLALPVLTSALVVGTAGCTAIADPSAYRYDVGCDLTLRLYGFTVHTGSRLEVRVDTPSVDDITLPTTRRGIAILDKVPANTFTLTVPRGAFASDANIDFYADITAPFGAFNPTLSPSNPARGDHSWTIHGACNATPNEFTHNLNFADFTDSTGPGSDFQFQTLGLLAANKNVEIRMIQYDPYLDAVDGTGDGRYTLVFYRREADVTDDFTTDVIPAMLDRGVDSTVEVWVDRNGDQIVQDTNDPLTDEGYVFEIPASPSGSGPLVLDVASVGTTDHSGAACVVVDP